MEGLIWIALIIGIVNVLGSRKKKQQEEAKRRAAQQAQQMQQAPPPEDPRFPAYGAPARRNADPRFPDLDEHPSQAAASADIRFPESTPDPEQSARRVRQQEAERELAEAKRAAQERLRRLRQQQAAQPMEARVAPVAHTPMRSRLEEPQGRQHTLEASFISGHAHTESSLTGGQEECPPQISREMATQVRTAQPAVAAPSKTPTAEALGRLSRNRDALVLGVLMSEVLGKPKALRRS